MEGVHEPGVIAYTMAGGLKATFLASYIHTAIIFAFIYLFIYLFIIINFNDHLESIRSILHRIGPFVSILARSSAEKRKDTLKFI